MTRPPPLPPHPRASAPSGASALDAVIPTDPLAAASCWIGIFSLMLCALGVIGGPVAIALGVMALRKRRFAESRYGRATSTARAWIGIATGTAALVVGAFFWISTAGRA